MRRIADVRSILVWVVAAVALLGALANVAPSAAASAVPPTVATAAPPTAPAGAPTRAPTSGGPRARETSKRS